MEEKVICEECDKQVSDDIAWGPDGDGVHLCPPCAYAHLESLIPDEVNQMGDDPDADPPTKDTQIQQLEADNERLKTRIAELEGGL